MEFNLDLLQRFVEDGQAKHKLFTELKDVVQQAKGLKQFVEELKAQTVTAQAELKLVADNRDAVIKEAHEAQNNAVVAHATVEQQVTEDIAALRSNLQAVKSQVEAEIAAMNRVKELLKDEIVGLRNERSTVVEERKREAAKIVAQLQEQQKDYTDKLAAAKLAYETFLSSVTNKFPS